jgi:hypothetical protein
MSVLKYKDPKTGEVKKVGSPQVDAYNKAEVDAKLANHANNKNNPHGVTITQIGAAPAYTYGTTELTEGVSALETGKLYFVYE